MPRAPRAPRAGRRRSRCPSGSASCVGAPRCPPVPSLYPKSSGFVGIKTRIVHILGLLEAAGTRRYGQPRQAGLVLTIIYKISDVALWREAERAGVFAGAPIDVTDGFVHFSTAAQAVETAARHFAGRSDLVLVAVDAEALGGDLRYEPSRGGALFP